MRFLDRNDYCLNSNGEHYVDHLPIELLDIRKSLFNEMLENYSLFYEYLTRDYELTDTVRQKDLRPSIEEIGLPIIDI